MARTNVTEAASVDPAPVLWGKPDAPEGLPLMVAFGLAVESEVLPVKFAVRHSSAWTAWRALRSSLRPFEAAPESSAVPEFHLKLHATSLLVFTAQLEAAAFAEAFKVL
jgi:hypothetical protein